MFKPKLKTYQVTIHYNGAENVSIVKITSYSIDGRNYSLTAIDSLGNEFSYSLYFRKMLNDNCGEFFDSIGCIYTLVELHS